MAEVTGRIGDADVALDNAATETTLRALLLATVGSKAEYKKLMALANKTLDPRKVEAANEALLKNAIANNQASSASGLMTKAFGLLGAVLGDLTAHAVKTAGNLADFAGNLMSGTATLSGFYGAFKDLPLGLGVVAGLFEILAKVTEENLAMFRQLTKVGVNFGGDLDSIRLQALSMGLTMQEYSDVISVNSEAIALLSTNVNDGAAVFRKISSRLTTGDLSNQLLNLGYGFKEINELTASYIKINGGLTTSQLKNTDQVQRSVIAYAKELDILARITGNSRELLQKQQEEQAADLNFSAYMNTLDADQRDKANEALKLALASGGKGAADALKAKLMGLPPLTEEAQMYYATMASGRESIEAFSDVVGNGRTLQQSRNQMDKIFSQAVSGNIRDLSKFRTVLAAGGMTGDKFSSTLRGVQAATETFMKRGMTEEGKIQATIREERLKQIELDKSGAAAQLEVEKQFKEAGEELYKSFLPVIKMITPAMQKFALFVTNFIQDNAQEIGQAVEKVVKFLQNLFTPEGRDKILNDIADMIAKLLNMIWDRFSVFGFTSEQRKDSDKMRQDQDKGLTDSPGLGAYASGGVTNKPSIFGEAGWEAAVPLPDNRTIPVTLSMPDELKNLNMNVASAADNSGSKDLLEELQLLNKNIATLITHSKTNVDINRSNLDALKGLNGNLFA